MWFPLLMRMSRDPKNLSEHCGELQRGNKIGLEIKDASCVGLNLAGDTAFCSYLQTSTSWMIQLIMWLQYMCAYVCGGGGCI